MNLEFSGQMIAYSLIPLVILAGSVLVIIKSYSPAKMEKAAKDSNSLLINSSVES
jgi:hypothetical protein